MALTWPTTGIVAPQVFQISPREQMVGEPSPYTGARDVMFRWHQWHVLMQWNHTPHADYWGMFGHFNRSLGGKNLFEIPIFSYREKRGTKTGTVTLSGSHAAGVTALTLSGGGGVFLRGDWFWMTQGGVPRAYVITSSESAGSINVNPPLRQTTGGGTVLHQLAEGLIKDTMELPVDTTFSAGFATPTPGLFQPFSVELVSALRANP